MPSPGDLLRHTREPLAPLSLHRLLLEPTAAATVAAPCFPDKCFRRRKKRLRRAIDPTLAVSLLVWKELNECEEDFLEDFCRAWLWKIAVFPKRVNIHIRDADSGLLGSLDTV